MGKEVLMKKDLELRPEDIKDKDILISLGKNFHQRSGKAKTFTKC